MHKKSPTDNKYGLCSVRVGNELGAGHPKVAKFSVFVVNGTSILISIVFSAIVLIFKVGLSKLFTSDAEVIDAVSNLIPLLAISVFLNGIQPILSGMNSICQTLVRGIEEHLSEAPFLTFSNVEFQVLQLEVDGKEL